jgi:large subunit ribosomal protein L28e
MAHIADHFPSDLLWEVTSMFDSTSSILHTNKTPTEGWNAFQVKRREHGGVNFSRDPFNLTNRQSHRHSGFINNQAIGISSGEGGGLSVVTKKHGTSHQPAAHHHTTTISKKQSSRKTNRSVVNGTTKRGYRLDLHRQAVARSSALKKSHQPKKDAPVPKPRGKKAKAEAEKSS